MNAYYLLNKTFKTTGGITFTILNIEAYPEEKVGRQFKGVLTIKEGHLVAVNYRKTLIPNITLSQGVARVTAVSVGDKTFDRPGVISTALGITEHMIPIGITEVK